MIDERIRHEVEAHRIRMGYDDETVVLDEDDVEGHGMLGVVAAVAIMSGSAGGTMLADGGSALAPEPAVLQSTLTSGTQVVPVYYVNTNIESTARYLGTSWSYNPSLTAGTPCVTYWPVPAGTVTGKVIQATGSYRRCY